MTMKMLIRRGIALIRLPLTPGWPNSVVPDLSSRRRLLKGLSSVFAISGCSTLLAPLRALAKPENLAAVETLRDSLEGSVIAAHDDKYENFRLALVWQMLKPSRYPALIVQAASVADVIHAVNFARQHNYRISIRCGGHNYVSSFLYDGALALDISRLQGIEVDPQQRTVKVAPGVHGRALTEELAKHGFAFPVSHPGRIAMGGYLLGGGQGWNSQAWGGAACLNIESVDVVTAEGQLITAHRQKNADLYWAARGAGPCFFGVVTGFTLKLYDNPGAILRSTYVWPIDAAAEVSAWVYKKTMDMPDFVETWFFLTAAPSSDMDNEQTGHSEKICVLQSSAFASDEASARAALAPLADIEEELQASCLDRHEFEKTSLLSLLDETDAVSLPWHYAVDNMWTDHPPEALAASLIDHMATMPSDKSTVIFLFRPHAGQTPGDALPVLGKTYFLCFNVWTDADQTRVNIEWRDRTMALATPYSKGHYINEADFLARPSRIKNSFRENAWKKLKVVRDKYDPNHVFHTQLH